MLRFKSKPKRESYYRFRSAKPSFMRHQNSSSTSQSSSNVPVTNCGERQQPTDGPGPDPDCGGNQPTVPNCGKSTRPSLYDVTNVSCKLEMAYGKRKRGEETYYLLDHYQCWELEKKLLPMDTVIVKDLWKIKKIEEGSCEDFEYIGTKDEKDIKLEYAQRFCLLMSDIYCNDDIRSNNLPSSIHENVQLSGLSSIKTTSYYHNEVMENENEARKKYNMRADRKEVYPRVQVKLKKKRRKKYELRQLNGGVIKYEQLCRMKEDPPDCCRIYIDAHISYGIFTTRPVEQNEVLLEYKGKLVTREESEALHKYYAKNGLGCYIIDFVHNEQKLCIDATMATDTLGRYVNDSVQRYANCEMKKFVVDDVPHLFLVAKKDIGAGVELRYDYGDHTHNLYWRGVTCYKQPLILNQVIDNWMSDFAVVENKLGSRTLNNNNGEPQLVAETTPKLQRSELQQSPT